MEEINKQAKEFSDFLDFADDKMFTMEQLMKTGFFESSKEAKVFFRLWKGYYVTNETYANFLDDYILELFLSIGKDSDKEKETKE